ncbi:GNAT family N-acetyltransferase [Flavobacteriaceae bacterium SZ-1-7]|uniref:GNAT family N-acetyltransferase n=1 Tax=Tamlana sedimenti TaxID=3134126 RepID=UPI0031290F5C
MTHENLSYAINLKGFDSIDSYVRNRFGKNARHIFKKRKRLELCLNISCKKYVGVIGEGEYAVLMSALKIMLIVRFKQRNDINEVLTSWEELTNNLIHDIRSNKASLFVIYDSNEPIQISIQYHFGKIMRAAINGYDIVYEKFSLGSMALYEQAKWCLENGYEILDQGYGYLDHKRMWSNYIYHYKHQVCFSKQFKSVIVGNLVYLKFLVKEYLKSKGIKEYWEELKNRINKKGRETESRNIDHSFNIINQNFDFKGVLKEMDFNSSKGLKKITNDFLYATVEHIDDVKMFQVLNEKNTYFLKGKQHAQKFLFVEYS